MTTSRSSTIDESVASFDSPTDPAKPTDPLAQTGQRVVEDAGHLASRATDIGYQQADRGRSKAAEGMGNVAESIRRLSDEIQTEQPSIASAASTAADQVDRLAGYLQETDAREIVGNIEKMARRQPLIFLGGAFLLGVAASRFIKAGTQTHADTAASADSGMASLGTARRDSGVDLERAKGYRATGPGGTATFDEGL